MSTTAREARHEIFGYQPRVCRISPAEPLARSSVPSGQAL